jgi:hypothetical protein
MAYRKFEIKYGKKGVETKEVPFSKQEWDAIKIPGSPVKAKAPKAQVKPNLPPGPPKAPGPNRAQQVAEDCVRRGIWDPIIVMVMIREIYAGSNKDESYLKAAHVRAMEFIKKNL